MHGIVLDVYFRCRSLSKPLHLVLVGVVAGSSLLGPKRQRCCSALALLMLANPRFPKLRLPLTSTLLHLLSAGATTVGSLPQSPSIIRDGGNLSFEPWFEVWPLNKLTTQQ